MTCGRVVKCYVVVWWFLGGLVERKNIDGKDDARMGECTQNGDIQMPRFSSVFASVL